MLEKSGKPLRGSSAGPYKRSAGSEPRNRLGSSSRQNARYHGIQLIPDYRPLTSGKPHNFNATPNTNPGVSCVLAIAHMFSAPPACFKSESCASDD